MEIHFVRGGPSYLPELDAYRAHVLQLGIATCLHATDEHLPADAQVIWWMCGRVPPAAANRWPQAFHVHEYASASVPPWSRIKDRVKRWTQPRPAHRVFQSEWLRERMGFGDAVPYSLRDMGVPGAFLHARPVGPVEFDLVYLGEMGRLAGYAALLQELDQRGVRLLLIGDLPPALLDLVHGLRHAVALGRVPQADVPSHLLRARAGLNLMPLRLPYTRQTPTKVLEYLAVGLPVVSNDYEWIRLAAQRHPGRILRAGSLDPAAWHDAIAHVPAWESKRSHLVHLTWEARLAHLPVWEAITDFMARKGP